MTNKLQLFGLFICTQSAVHVSSDVFAHLQEHLTVFTVSDIVHPCCCRPVSWIHLVLNTGQQQHKWTIREAVNTVKCSWCWTKTSPETCRADWVQINRPKSCILLVINYELYRVITFIRYTGCFHDTLYQNPSHFHSNSTQKCLHFNHFPVYTTSAVYKSDSFDLVLLYFGFIPWWRYLVHRNM